MSCIGHCLMELSLLSKLDFYFFIVNRVNYKRHNTLIVLLARALVSLQFWSYIFLFFSCQLFFYMLCIIKKQKKNKEKKLRSPKSALKLSQDPFHIHHFSNSNAKTPVFWRISRGTNAQAHTKWPVNQCRAVGPLVYVRHTLVNVH